MFPFGLLEMLREAVFLVGYIAGNNAFPQPLSPQKERHYLQLFAQGDMDARNKLIEHNLRLVAHIVKKYPNTGVDNEDLVSIGTIGLIKAITTFDAQKGAQLATYAARCIENEILMAIRSVKKKRNEISLQGSMGIDKEGNEITLGEILGSMPEDIAERVQNHEEIKKMHQLMGHVLDARERMIIEMRYGLYDLQPKTQREIARMLGISRSYVSRIEKRGVEKLKKHFQHS